ncbi:MAG: hypothetical protein HY318_08115 [Armatimonadetes bacterium]|nr:hypothetical protein [Armatimonadota bacterium]
MPFEKRALTPFIVLVASICSLSVARAQQTWTIEAESPSVGRDKAVTVADDAAASGGKVLMVPSTGVPQWNVAYVGFPEGTTTGRYRITLRVKMDNAADVGKGWRIDVRDDARLLAYSVIYGTHVKGPGYHDFSFNCDYTNPQRRPALYMRWTGNDGKPALTWDSCTFTRVDDLPPVRITRVWPDRIRYKPGENGTVAVAVENLSTATQTCEVRVTLQHDLDEPKSLGTPKLTVDPGKTAEVQIPLRHDGGLFGYGLKAVALVEGKEVDAAEEYFCVHSNPWAVATGAHDEEWAEYTTPWWAVFYTIGQGDPAIDAAVLAARKDYTTCTEFFSWSPGECFYMNPKEPFWIRGNGGDLLRSKRELQREVAGLKSHGIGCITYIAYQAMGEHTLELVQQKPEWFAYSPDTGDHLEFYNVNELEKRKEFWKKFDWEKYKSDGDSTSPGWQNTPESAKKYEEFWKGPSEECRKLSIIGYFVPNYKLPEVVDYCADQAIASAKMFGWDGLRWDCGHLNTGPIWGSFKPFVDFSGKPLAPTPAEMVPQTIANLKRLKTRIHKQLPDFAIGTNYGSWMETHTYPKMTEELCRDGGWLLDEFSYGYNAATSPYHWWDKYYAIMADEGEHVTSLGGHYNPFAFNRNGGTYPVDRLYETIFRIAGHGHPNSIYYNSRTPAGNFAQFCVRFGRFVFDPAIRRVDKPEEIITVQSAATLWWNKTVGRLKDGNSEYQIVHLINPPVAAEVETDPMSRLNPPVAYPSVSIKLPAGKSKTKAWALTAESWKTGDTPKTQAVSLDVKIEGARATVIVPEVLYWKMVVWRVE